LIYSNLFTSGYLVMEYIRPCMNHDLTCNHFRTKFLRNVLFPAALIGLLTSGFTIAKADKLQKGFERLQIHDYFRAKEYFEKSLKKKPAGAAFGLSVIYSRNSNPFYNLDSARKYVLISDSAYQQLMLKKKNYYSAFGVHEAAIQFQKDSICEKAFREAQLENEVMNYNHFINEFIFCSQTGNAVALRSKAAFNAAWKINSSASWQNFIESYPDAPEYAEAKSHYEERLFDEITSDKKISSYEKFISLYPESPYRMQAEKMIYEKATLMNSADAFYQFILKYPANRFVNEAWRKIYELSTKDYTEQAFLNFKKRFPDYPFMNELETDFRLQQSFFIPVKRNNLWGYINSEGKEMIHFQYDEASLFSDGIAFVQKNGKYGYINKSGIGIIPFEYDDAEILKNNMAVVMKGEKYGLISRSNANLIPFEFDELSEPAENICIAVKNEKSAYISTSGTQLTGFDFDFAGEFRNGYAIAGMDDKYGLINNAGHFVIPPKFDNLFFVAEGKYKAESDDTWGIISISGDTLLPFEYDAIGEFSESRALIVKNRKCGFVDGNFRIAIPAIYPFNDFVLNNSAFVNGYVLLRQKNKSILLDSSGNKITFANAEDYGLPGGGLFPVKKNRKWGYVNERGQVKIAARFEDAARFVKGLAIVRFKKNFGVIDSSGNFVIHPMNDKIVFSNNVFITTRAGMSGIVNLNGETLLENYFEKIEFVSPSVISFERSGKRKWMNIDTGKIIFSE